MQHIKIISVGKAGGFYAGGVAEYAKRLGALCRFETLELPAEYIDESRAGAAAIEAALKKEGRAILAHTPQNARLAALCVEGRALSTGEFSAFLQNAAQSGAPDVVFAVGSSHGLAPEVKQRAALRLSLSAMTLPHQLARLTLTEQIYRALMILGGAKYHK